MHDGWEIYPKKMCRKINLYGKFAFPFKFPACILERARTPPYTVLYTLNEQNAS